MSNKPGVARRRLAAKLRSLREERGDISVEHVMRELDWSRSKVSRIETAMTSVSVPDVRALCAIYEVDGELAEFLVGLCKQAKKRGWWRSYDDALTDYFGDYVELESEAASVCNFEIDLVPGLLQTEDYARSIIESWAPDLPDDLVRRRTEVRVARQQRLGDGLALWAIVDESALHRRCGDGEVMSAQLEHLREMSERPGVTVQVLPFEIGTHVAMGTAFTMLDFATLYDPVVYLDNLSGASYLEEAAEVDRYRQVFEHLRASALDPRVSRRRLDELRHRHAA
ncbi:MULTISPECIES: helix-turn-helix transcriptional regulator [unclassified Saccharopolyspora]|uniref:helix-turn-helix domain-containing protein n=1 Tax=unclassified Saccharopolyspora TaxID=2646250 RepID=UPI001CD27DAE|nr:MULTISPECIES: helix-turn-helix transcriptional regulator [unclassified Saccharopolyspora]MCA1189733.1 helix-turn-helix domain-containing protein [Saccharopolyspora sp. 6T]MCA1192046.1 helix-turn-helix domain-containing protein [Saccharopolyspora sp. 6V]MCA1226160.1 helix-turn-helix domain-containing protein [Saccharopolyspora sp. 6M]